MKSELSRAVWFDKDFEAQYEWYFEQAGESVAERFLEALEDTLESLVKQPNLGRQRKFRHNRLHNLRSYPVARPFGRILIFYRLTEMKLEAWRLMDGARDLPRRFIEPRNFSQ